MLVGNIGGLEGIKMASASSIVKVGVYFIAIMIKHCSYETKMHAKTNVPLQYKNYCIHMNYFYCVQVAFDD